MFNPSPGGLAFENRRWLSEFVVDASASEGSRGTYTTLTAATAAASSGDAILIRPGTYIENFTAKAGVTYIGVSGVGTQLSTTSEIVGKVTFDSAGSFYFENVRLTTNSDNAVLVSGSNATVAYFKECYFYGTNADIINITNTSTGSAVLLNYCLGIQSDSASKFYDMSGSGRLEINFCYLQSVSNGAASTMSAGDTRYKYTYMQYRMSVSGAAQLRMSNVNFNPQQTSGTALTFASSATFPGNSITNSMLVPSSFDTTTCVSISASSTMEIHDTSVFDGTANGITGSGTLNYSNLAMPRGAISTVTTNAGSEELHGPISFNEGADFLSDYEEGSFTPTSLGLSSAGTGTYTIQSGSYTKIGNRVFFQAYVGWSAHTGTGNLAIGSLPFTASNTTNRFHVCPIYVSNMTYTGSQVTAYVQVNSTNVYVQQFSSAGAASGVTLDTAMTIMVSGNYYV